MPARLQLTGQTFERLTVIGFAYVKKRRIYWYCQCVCGTRCIVQGTHLRSGKIQSCKCRMREGRLPKHGMCRSPEYGSWTAMLTRCRNPRQKHYKDYGGRGITVDERWLSFEEFFKDMGPKPSPEHSLDRYPDNNGPYSKENCRWATHTEQRRNSRSMHWITYNGKTLCLNDWALALGMKPGTLIDRIKSGWSIERALTEPLHANKGPHKH